MIANCDGPINALSANRDSTAVVVAGRNVLKVINVASESHSETHNLRNVRNLNLNYGALDVAWSHLEDNRIATAATNRTVVIWNLGKSGKNKIETTYTKHDRTVNKVAFHHTEPNYVLSGSQDYTVKLFDLRNQDYALNFKWKGANESIRDVKFCPTQPYTFAAADEAGNVQLWDLRFINEPQKHFNAHGAPIFSIDFHPSAKSWIATASRDKLIRVWDWESKSEGSSSVTERRQAECVYIVQTIAPVNVIRWRKDREWQIASASLVMDFTIHVWDVRRPFIPFASFDKHKDVCTGIVWRDARGLLSAGKDGFIMQHDFDEALRPGDYANPVTIDLSPSGDVAFATSKRLVDSSNKSTPSPVNDGSSLSSRQAGSSTVSRLPSPIVTSIRPSDQFRAPIQSHLTVFLKNPAEECLSMSWFTESAQRYKLHGDTIENLCLHNSQVAGSLNRFQVAQTWLILKTLFHEIKNGPGMREKVGIGGTKGGVEEKESLINRKEDQELGHNNKAAVGMEINGQHDTFNDPIINNSSFHHSQLFYQQSPSKSNKATEFSYPPLREEWSIGEEAFVPRDTESLAVNPSSSLISAAGQPSPIAQWEAKEEEEEMVIKRPGTLRVIKPETLHNRPWNPNHLITKMLHYYVDQGDVQTAASVLLVLGEKGKNLVSYQTKEHWFLAYLDLLEEFEEWVCSGLVRSLCPIGSIQAESEEGVFLNIGCGRCNKGTGKVGWICERCKQSTPPCSICGTTVRGLYVWCRVCQHGGHLPHLKHWFATNRLCPTGCGHACEFL